MHHLTYGLQAFWLQAAPASPLGGYGGLLMPLAIAGIFYVMIFMPMQKQKKQQEAMLSALEAGKEVITSGGIVGTIVSVSSDSLILRIRPDNVKLQVARSAVASVVTPADAVPDAKKAN
jgi:preprotein translocase subunit YajC